MIAYCGLVCDNCPIHLATLEPVESKKHAMRVEIASLCNEKYGMTLSASDINDCDGCTAGTERLFSNCKNCNIRKCAMTKNLKNCGYCPEYACDLLKKMFLDEPEAKKTFENKF